MIHSTNPTIMLDFEKYWRTDGGQRVCNCENGLVDKKKYSFTYSMKNSIATYDSWIFPVSMCQVVPIIHTGLSDRVSTPVHV